MLFKLDTPTEARLTTFTARTEHHGDELVSALTLGLTITGPNTLLDLVSDTLRDALYRRVDDAQEALDGVPAPTPKLRTRQLSGALPLTLPPIVGGTLFVAWGISDDDMTFGDCKVGHWKAECFEGGSCALSLKVSTSDVSEEEAGHLFGKQGQTLMIRFEPPAPQPERVETGQVIDGTTGHPGAGPLFDQVEDDDHGATEAFLGIHGDVSGDQEGDDGARGDDDGVEHGENWPFPQTDENGEPVRGDAAEAAAAEQPAPPSRRGRRAQREAH